MHLEPLRCPLVICSCSLSLDTLQAGRKMQPALLGMGGTAGLGGLYACPVPRRVPSEVVSPQSCLSAAETGELGCVVSAPGLLISEVSKLRLGKSSLAVER